MLISNKKIQKYVKNVPAFNIYLSHLRTKQMRPSDLANIMSKNSEPLDGVAFLTEQVSDCDKDLGEDGKTSGSESSPTLRGVIEW